MRGAPWRHGLQRLEVVATPWLTALELAACRGRLQGGGSGAVQDACAKAMAWARALQLRLADRSEPFAWRPPLLGPLKAGLMDCEGHSWQDTVSYGTCLSASDWLTGASLLEDMAQRGLEALRMG